MAYTALEKMRKYNEERFKCDLGPHQPAIDDIRTGMDLKSAALRFIHERCEGLLFDAEIEAGEERTGNYMGTSLKPNQIPYNMERDIDRLCLARSLENFFDSGTAEDAFTVYYCYIEMFMGRYGESKRMVEFLSEYEINGSSLLMKHRDHFSHSVYVFALGLAIYETNEMYCRIFNQHYSLFEDNCEDGRSSEAANYFLEHWGLTSLFHDIGYPFELPFEQVLSYFEANKKTRGVGCMYIAYRDTDELINLDNVECEHFKKLVGREFRSIEDVFAYNVAEKLGDMYSLDEEQLRRAIADKPMHPERCSYYMDHAYFSAVRIYRELVKCIGVQRITLAHLDVLTAILLHNSLFKFSISFYKDQKKRRDPLRSELHPLAYLLMLCDELQCWDRTAYGRNSRTELHPMAANFDFSKNAIHVTYYFDEEEKTKIDDYKTKQRLWENEGKIGTEPRLKAYSDIANKQRFVADINKIVKLTDLPLTVEVALRSPDSDIRHSYLSDSSFLHLYDFAVVLHGRNEKNATPEKLEDKYEALSLEYQLSGINRAKFFGRYLDAINCFFTDRSVDYKLVKEFTTEQAETIAPLEHERWIREHRAMGWHKSAVYESLSKDKNEQKRLREQLRCHKLVMDGELTTEKIREHYCELDERDQDKDREPFNKMLLLLKEYDGLRIYELNK